jgi:hypothetical protein
MAKMLPNPPPNELPCDQSQEQNKRWLPVADVMVDLNLSAKGQEEKRNEGSGE